MNPELRHLGSRIWDVVVVGAGPAGTMAAREAARLGCSVLLVDKASWPRPKVCGCCLNETALSVLEEVDLTDLPRRYGAKPLYSFQLAAGGSQSRIPLPRGMVLSREQLDRGLTEEAIASGVLFLPRTSAVLGKADTEARCLTLFNGSHSAEIKTRVVCAATGLNDSLTADNAQYSWTIAHLSRIGIGAMTGHAPDFYQDQTIYMACTDKGYVGLVRLEDDRLNIAAAVSPHFLKAAGRAGRAVEIILQQAGFPAIKNLADLSWTGTPPLSRLRSSPAGERIFFLGDAAGYTEPFTGEGIGWALLSGMAVAPLAAHAVRRWDSQLEKSWTDFLRRKIYPKQSICRWITSGVRNPLLTRGAVRILSQFPGLAQPILHKINQRDPK